MQSLALPNSILALPKHSTSDCTLADPETFARENDVRLLTPPLPLVVLSNDIEFSSLTRAFLQHAGFSVSTCTTSDRAESLFLHRSDLQFWIVDVQALGIEAVYFAARVHELHPSMPILLITSEQRTPNSLRQFLLHGWLQLTKPIDLPELLATINDELTNARANVRMGHFFFDSPGFQPDPFDSDSLDAFQRIDITRLRN